MPEELNPAQRGVSVDVLAERLSNQTDMVRSEFTALHHHFSALEVKVDAVGAKTAGIEVALREHEAQQHHTGTRDRLLQLGDRLLEFERKFSQQDKEISVIKQERLVEATAAAARAKQRSQGLSAVDKAIALAMGGAVIVLQVLR